MSDWRSLAQPGYVYSGQQLAHGELPLWNTHWFAGYPHLAVPSNAVLYPTTVIFGLTGFGFAVKIVVLLHLFGSAVASYWLGRDMYASRPAGLFLAFTAAAGTLTSVYLVSGHLWALMTTSWLPPAFLFLRRTLQHGRLIWAMLFALVVALMMLAGDPQTLAYVLLWLGAYTATELVLRLLGRVEPARRTFTKGILCLGGVLFAAALAAAQLLPSREFIEQSVRKDGVTYEYFSGLYAPGAFIRRYIEQAFYMLDPLQNTIFSGKATLALAFAAILGRATREIIALWVAVLICLLYGNASPELYENVIGRIPIYNSFRGSGRIGGMVVYLSWMLAGHGICALASSAADRHGRRWRATATGLIAIAFAVIPLWKSSPVSWFPLAMLGAVLALTAALIWRPLPRGLVALALTAILVTESARLHLRNSIAGDSAIADISKDLATFSKERTDLDRILIVPGPRIANPHGAAVTLLTGDRNAEGYHALYLYRYARLLREVAGLPMATVDDEGRLSSQGAYGGDWLTLMSLPLLNALNVRHYVRPFYPIDLPRRLKDIGDTRFSYRTLGDLHIYTNRLAFPPLYPIHETVTATDDEAIALMRSGKLDLRRRATLEPGAEPPALAPSTGRESITILKYGPSSIEALVQLTAPGLVVASEMWYPGWHARIDGGPLRPALCVNTALQATPVDAGNHKVEFIFHPQSFYRGAAISAAAILIWIACAIALLIRHIRRPRTDTETP